ISLTPAGMANARARLLLIRGQSKREAFERAIASGDMLQWPVLAALSADDAAPLQIYWCP
ncbi:MAG: 6-phosphogluconolactonase, partial [Lysobacter sp.]|nr:6-phosphogluconolactonase [Lysobacter sp.]